MKISLIISIHKNLEYLVLQSVAKQIFKNFEVITVK